MVGLLSPREDDEADAAAVDDQASSVVQFSTAMYYCCEAEGQASVDVVRLGDDSGTVYFSYRTEDGSAKAGLKYVPQSNTVKMEPGETTKTLQIKILQEESWDATLEFSVVLTQVRFAQMGKYLHLCRVSIIDSDAFPTNKYKEEVSDSGAIQQIFGPSLMLEYVRMNLRKRPIRVATVKCILLDQVKSLYFLMTLYLQLYLVDVVLEPAEEERGERRGEEEPEGAERRLLLGGIRVGARMLSRALGEHEEASEGSILVGEGQALLVPGSRRNTAIVVGLLYVVPFALMHIIDLWKISLGLAGACRKVLQANLLRKFLNYREEIRDTVPNGDLTMAMMRDITEVVEFGYMKLLQVIQIIGKLCFALIFILAENRMAVLPLCIFPIVMGCFLICREKISARVSEEAAHGQNHMVHVLNDGIANFRLIADFHLRPFVVGTYEDHIDRFNKRKTAEIMVMTNNTYLSPWLTTMLVGLYMVAGTFQVKAFGGPLSLGAFLATVNVFKEIGVELQEIYVEMMEIQRTFGPLRKLSHYMNLPTDLNQRMQVNRERRRVGKARREEARQSLASGTERRKSGIVMTDKGEALFAVDTVKIELVDLTFRYGNGEPVMRSVNMQFEQGRLYVLVGGPSQGKATLLKLLGQVLVPEPQSGYIFVPPHLRVLHVSRDPLVLNDTFLKNIIFNRDCAMLGGRARIRKVCELIGFSEHTVRLLDKPEDVAGGADEEGAMPSKNAWAAHFSHSDFARLNLARALVMNPECLVMHTPFISLASSATSRMLYLLRAHVDERGLDLPQEGRPFRRPRTVFFSSPFAENLEQADEIYELSRTRGLQAVSYKEPR